MNDDTEAADAAADAPREAERPASPGAALAVSLRAGAERSAVGTPLEITVTARNTSGEDARLLLWNTPFEPTLSAGMFAVERDGETLPYRGRNAQARSIPPAGRRRRPPDRRRRAGERRRPVALLRRRRAG